MTDLLQVGVRPAIRGHDLQMTRFTIRVDFYRSVVVDLITKWFIDPWYGPTHPCTLIGDVTTTSHDPRPRSRERTGLRPRQCSNFGVTQTRTFTRYKRGGIPATNRGTRSFDVDEKVSRECLRGYLEYMCRKRVSSVRTQSKSRTLQKALSAERKRGRVLRGDKL